MADGLLDATYLINIPTFKAHVTGAGVSLGFNNHQGSHNNPSALHAYVWTAGQYFPSVWNALVDLNRSIHIRNKTALTIGEGIFTGDRYNSAPRRMRTFGNQIPNSYFFPPIPWRSIR